MCRYVCIGFIDYILKDKSLLDYTILFSPIKFEKNDEMIIKFVMKFISNNTIICSKCVNENEKN